MNKFELRRKSIHFIGGMLLITLIYFEIIAIMHLFVLWAITISIFYTASKKRLPVVQWLVDIFEREKFRKTFPGKGVIFFLTGTFLAVLLFPKNIAIASLIILTIGDGVSSLFGMEYGRVRHPFSNEKFIEGHVVGALSAFTVVMAFKLFLGLNVAVLPTALAAIAALFVEGIDFKLNKLFIDDNIIIPLVSGAVLWLMQFLP